MNILKNKSIYTIFTAIFIAISALILVFVVRGELIYPGPAELGNFEFKDTGPMELSPERGRFALLYTLVEDRSVHLSDSAASFSTPDLAITEDGKYVSLFSPGMSFVLVPGYIIGKIFGATQVGAFGMIALFALLNSLLIAKIAELFGVNKVASKLAGFTYLFATTGLVYAVSLFQHQISTFLILSSLYVLFRWKKSLWPLLYVWLAAGFSLLIDNPNFFFMFPIGIYAIARIFPVTKKSNDFVLQIRLLGLASLLVFILPVMIFMSYNKLANGSPFKLSGTLETVQVIDEFQIPENDLMSLLPDEEKTAIGFFKTRNMLNGFQVLFLGNERSILFYSPIALLGIIGGWVLYTKGKHNEVALISSVMGSNIILYSMWGDVWGGWAFGPRYLVPSLALLSIFIAAALHRYGRNILFIVIFIILFGYSSAVNSLGSLTTSRIPPKHEAIYLSQISGVEEKYTYARNIDILLSGSSKSFMWQEYVSDYLTAKEYYLIILSSINLMAILLIILNIKMSEKK